MKRRNLALTLIILLCVAAVGAAFFWVYRNLRTPVAHNKSGEYIEISRGSSPGEIVDKLLSQGVIRRGNVRDISPVEKVT